MELETLFPSLFNDPLTKEFYTLIKKRTSLLLQSITDPDPNLLEQIEKIDEQLFEKNAPRTYSGPKGLEVKLRKGFEDNCMLIRQHSAGEPEKMTVLTFYRTIERLKEQLKKRK